jgi:hypothetical protein
VLSTVTMVIGDERNRGVDEPVLPSSSRHLDAAG